MRIERWYVRLGIVSVMVCAVHKPKTLDRILFDLEKTEMQRLLLCPFFRQASKVTVR